MALLAIQEAGPERREELVNVFISDRWEQWKGIALQQCRASGRSYNVYLDDVTTLVGLTVWKLVTEIVAEEPEVLRSKSRNLNYLIQKNVRNSVRSFFYSEAGGAAVAGMDNVIRRQNEIRKTRSDLTNRGMLEPTDAEIIEAANTRLTDKRKDAARQGILLSEKDFLPQVTGSTMSYDSSTMDSDIDGTANHQEDYVLHPVEGRQIITEVIAEAYTVSHDLGMIAELWIGEFYPTGHALNNQADIARETGLTKQQVSRSIAKIKKIARDLLGKKLNAEDLAEYI
jgi:hypothetical protein